MTTKTISARDLKVGDDVVNHGDVRSIERHDDEEWLDAYFSGGDSATFDYEQAVEITAEPEVLTDARPIIEQAAAVLGAASAAVDAIHRALGEDLAARLTCTEMDAVAALYRALDRDPTEILAAHAAADTELGDRHGGEGADYRCDDCEYRVDGPDSVCPRCGCDHASPWTTQRALDPNTNPEGNPDA